VSAPPRSVHIDYPVDWDHFEDLVEGAYRQIAPKTLIARLDER